VTERLPTWFRDGRAEVDHFTSAPRRSVPGLMGGGAVCGRPSRVARQAPPHTKDGSQRPFIDAGGAFYFPKKARWSCLDCEDESRGFESASTASSATFR